MPIYEYICEDCQTHFEKIVLNKTQEIACPKCAGKRNAIQLSVFSAANGSSNGVSAKSSGGSSNGGGSCCGGGCGCNWPPRYRIRGGWLRLFPFPWPTPERHR